MSGDVVDEAAAEGIEVCIGVTGDRECVLVCRRF